MRLNASDGTETAASSSPSGAGEDRFDEIGFRWRNVVRGGRSRPGVDRAMIKLEDHPQSLVVRTIVAEGTCSMR
jgi:hypothetical protein